MNRLPEGGASAPRRRSVADLFAAPLVLAGVWTGFNGADVGSWIVGAPAVLGAVLIGRALFKAPPVRLAPGQVLPFAGFFLSRSVLGAMDVARKAFQPVRRLHPAFVEYSLRLPPSPARSLFLACISLLPGTCVVSLESRWLVVHALDATVDVSGQLGDLERRVAQLLRTPLTPDRRGEP